MAQAARVRCRQSACRGARPGRRRTVETLAKRRLCRDRPAFDCSRFRGLGRWAAPTKKRLPARSSAKRRHKISPAAICAMRSSRSPLPAVAVSNDSGLLHVAAALGTPSIGIFGPTSPWHWAPLNSLAGTWRRQASCRAGPAISRFAASPITAACAKSPRNRSSPQPATPLRPFRRLTRPFNRTFAKSE